jgi:hypothetical protein
MVTVEQVSSYSKFLQIAQLCSKLLLTSKGKEVPLTIVRYSCSFSYEKLIPTVRSAKINRISELKVKAQYSLSRFRLQANIIQTVIPEQVSDYSFPFLFSFIVLM